MLEAYGHISDVGLQQAAEELQDLKTTHVPPLVTPEFVHFRKLPSPKSDAPLLEDVSALYVEGKIKSELIGRDVNLGTQDYMTNRKVAAEIVEAIRGGARVVLVLGRIASGKTSLLEAVSYALGGIFDIHILGRSKRGIEDDLSRIRACENPCLVVIDDYERALEVVRTLGIERNKNIHLLLSSRTSTHLLNREHLGSVITGTKVWEYRVDTLSEPEVRALDSILVRAGLLGSLAKEPLERRLRHYLRDCDAELRGILLWIIESPEIQTRIARQFEALDSAEAVQSVVISALALTYIQVSADLWDLGDLVGAESVNHGHFAEHQAVSDLVYLEGNVIRARSSFFAAAALKILWNGGLVADVIEMLIREAWMQRSERNSRIVKELMRYSTIKEFVPNHNKSEKIRAFYNKIRNLPACAENVLFWLQVAISEIDAGDFKNAEFHLTQSYGLASRFKGCDTSQLDNVRATFMLTRAIRTDRGANAFADFVTANGILVKQFREGRHRYYPFRVARLYGPYGRKYLNGFDDGQQKVFFTACEMVLKFSTRADPDLATFHEVRDCEAEMRLILKLRGESS
ncbi:MAG TPA: hypothetical protein VD970_03685 [Acetobacteraceae bacterium]|nr:hypothetical protein [Acetobacteraceae bacterium]